MYIGNKQYNIALKFLLLTDVYYELTVFNNLAINLIHPN